jgi:hypothetical protein
MSVAVSKIAAAAKAAAAASNLCCVTLPAVSLAFAVGTDKLCHRSIKSLV